MLDAEVSQRRGRCRLPELECGIEVDAAELADVLRLRGLTSPKGCSRLELEQPQLELGIRLSVPRQASQARIRWMVVARPDDLTQCAGPHPSRHRIDERNPVGRGFAVPGGALTNTPAHAIEYATGDPARTGPAGFGPIEPGWLPRRRLAGKYDAAWVSAKKPLLPDDYDPAFALAALFRSAPTRAAPRW